MFPVGHGRHFLLIAPLWLASTPLLAQSHPCPFGAGQRLDTRTCIRLEPRAAAEPARLEDAGRDAASLRAYCPTLALFRRAGDKITRVSEIKLPADSNLYDVSNCCLTFQLTSDPATRRFRLTGTGRDCFGGTARTHVNETYAINRAGHAKLLRNATTFQ